jgi:hypothetical protein
MSRARALVCLLASGCPRPTTDAAASPAPTPLEVAPAEPEPFLDPDADLAQAYPLRATIRRAGAIYVEHEGAPVNDPSNRNVRVAATVIDEDAGESPRRPRLLCESPEHRVAVFVDVDDLATVATTDATMVGIPPLRDALGSEPGIRLAPGAELVAAGHGNPDVLRMRHEGAFVRAEGLLPATSVGIAFRPGELPIDADGPPNAGIERATSLFATPHGVELAKLDPRGMGELVVRRLGPELGDRALVRYEEPSVHVVGWIEQKALADGPRSRRSSRTMTGVRRDEGPQMVELPRGTLLLASALRQPIGVVVAKTTMPCTDACDTDAPKVRAAACTAAIEVWARRPGS